MSVSGEPIGVYVHIPFCRRKCFYCDFPSVEGRDELAGKYVSALTREVVERGAMTHDAPVASIYFGGGTPSILSSENVDDILLAVRDNFNVLSNAEISIEANPESVTMEKLAGYRASGVNRVSIGVQSLDDAQLRFLERVHDADQARRAVEIAKAAGFANVSADFMFAIPGQTMESWTRTLTEAVEWGVTHLSCYELTPEHGTRLARAVERGEINIPENGADFFDEAERVLESLDFVHYEISNYARPGCECLHNVGYWELRDYVGLGAGAWGTFHGVRTENVRDPARYIERMETSGVAVSKEERLTPDNVKIERLMMGLRMHDGVSVADVEMTDNLRSLIADGFLETVAGRLRATSKGWRVLNLLLERV